MHRFGDQIEFRVDRRHLLFFFLGGVSWTLVAFFLGMLASTPGSGDGRVAERGLASLGWLDQKALTRMRERQSPVSFSFPRTRPKPRLVRRPAQPPPVVRAPVPLEPPKDANEPDEDGNSPEPTPPASVRPKPKPPAEPAPPAPRSRVAPAMGSENWEKEDKKLGLPYRLHRVIVAVANLRDAALAKKFFRKLGYRPSVRTFRNANGESYSRVVVGRYRTYVVALRVWKKVREHGGRWGKTAVVVQ